MFQKPGIAVFFLLAAAILIVSGCSIKNTQSLKKVAMIFDSPIANDAFSTACLHGAEMAKSTFGIGLDISESSTTPETESLQKKYAENKQYGLIICIGPSHAQPSNKNFSAFPQQKFVLVDGNIADKTNISSLLSRDNESSFLAGALAAMCTKFNRIGFIGGMDIPPIHRFLAGYQAGAAT